jgi:septal ring factor EnvC (AmiA/AmiB activator)
MNNNTIRNMFVTANNELIPLFTIPRDKYTTMILFTLFIMVNIFIQAADKLGDKIEAAVYKLRAEIATKNTQIEKQAEQLKALNNQIEKQAEQLKALNAQIEKQETK